MPVLISLAPVPSRLSSISIDVSFVFREIVALLDILMQRNLPASARQQRRYPCGQCQALLCQVSGALHLSSTFLNALSSRLSTPGIRDLPPPRSACQAMYLGLYPIPLHQQQSPLMCPQCLIRTLSLSPDKVLNVSSPMVFTCLANQQLSNSSNNMFSAMDPLIARGYRDGNWALPATPQFTPQTMAKGLKCARNQGVVFAARLLRQGQVVWASCSVEECHVGIH